MSADPEGVQLGRFPVETHRDAEGNTWATWRIPEGHPLAELLDAHELLMAYDLTPIDEVEFERRYPNLQIERQAVPRLDLSSWSPPATPES